MKKLDKLAHEILKAREQSPETNEPVLAHSSIEDGAILEHSGGSLVQQIGTQFDGTHAAVSLSGPVPPMPSQPICVGEFLRIKVTWNGAFTDANGVEDVTVIAPQDYSRVEVHASQDPDFTAEFNTTLVGTIETPRGTDVTFAAESGDWYVRLVTRTFSGARSVATPAVLTKRVESASVDSAGQFTGKTIDISDEIYFKGDPISVLLDSLPRGIVAWGGRSSTAATHSTSTTPLPYLRIAFDDVLGRRYKVDINALIAKITQSSGAGIVQLHWRTDGGDCTTADPVISKCQLGSAAGSTNLTTSGHMSRIFSASGLGVSMLISFFRNQSTGFFGLEPLADSSIFMVVQDLGLAAPTVAENLDANVAPPPAVKNYTVTYNHSAVRSYLGGDGHYNYNTAKGYQGLQPYTSNGNLKSIWTFPSVTTLLSGATVNKIEAYFYFEHWYYNAGGTARIRMHAHSSVPATFSATGNGMDSASWPIGAGRWVTVPSSLYSGWQSGAYRGFALVGDGTYQTYGIANAAKIRISYTK